MAQNLLLSYAAGGRILELKTVQINDRLTIGRPCIDATNVGYNIEWSQELRIEDSLREYAAGSMLIAMFRAARELTGGSLDSAAGDVVYDTSVGYDLAGIKSDPVRRFLAGMRDASGIVARLRDEIPAGYRAARELNFQTRLSDSITLSTFHGCPAGEIEAICEFLIGELEFDVIVKMNPPTLGRSKLEHLLHDMLGFRDIRVPDHAYTSVITFADSVELCRRLTRFAGSRGRRLGFKFSNTLEVENHRTFFKPTEKTMYLSGQPLHVITMALTDEFRRAVGPGVPISFSAGIDQKNFPAAVACGFVPVTICTDLLRPGGYGRLPAYLDALSAEMQALGASTIDEFIVRTAERGFAASDDGALSHSERHDPSSGIKPSAAAGVRNTSNAAAAARNDPRYRAERNAVIPKRIESRLTTFDCITCDKCLPVCPNAANFTYPTPLVEFDYRDQIVAPDGSVAAAPEVRRFAITKSMQIACFADFCNECGNCDTFCPEYGGPYIEKPSFFASFESWRRAAPRDGFVATSDGAGHCAIRGRIKGEECELSHRGEHEYVLRFRGVELVIDGCDANSKITRVTRAPNVETRVDMWVFHTLARLLDGVTDAGRVNQVNAASSARRAFSEG